MQKMIDEDAVRFARYIEAAREASKLDNPILMQEYKVTYKYSYKYPSRPWLIVLNSTPSY